MKSKTVSRSIGTFFLLVAFLSLAGSIQAQFTYAHANFSYHNLRFSKVEDGSSDNIALNELRLNLSFAHRIKRNIGLGMSIGLPVISGFKSNFSGAATTSGENFFIGASGDDISNLGEFQPSEFDHDLQNPYTLSFYPRIYFGLESYFYVDLRFNLMRLSEQFTFIRPAKDLPSGASIDQVNIRYDESFTASGFGIRLGVESQVSDHFIFSYGFIVDYYNFDNLSTFAYNVEFQETSNGFDEVRLSSAIAGKDISWQFGYGVAYVF